MNKQILRYSIVMVCFLLLSACNKYDRTEVFPELYINKSTVSGFIGQEIQLTASPTDGSYSFNWTSENPAVATVTNSGLVKLISEGSTAIELIAGNIKKRVDINSMTRIPVTEVTLSVAAVDLVPQATKNVTAVFLPDNANDIPNAVWSSENDRVATVNEKGIVTGISEGSTSIVYTMGSIVKKIKVTVSYTQAFNGPHILQTGPALVIMAADFDFGGIGRAFNDDPGNPMNNDSYRREKGDINSMAVEIEGPGDNIGYINNGEWYQYTIEVREAGKYELQVSLSAADASKYHVEVNNINVTGSIDLASNGSWGSWYYHKILELELTEGTHKIKFVAEQANFNFSALRFSKK